ncbi:hypothetical protein DAPPUDRAFT_115770 [Daphnia pulex]|uniref:Uncharacterized protein n=1 Tax=Daphnia pulex TaxID=6669 RepID=E9HMG1_DAPPU|nr:hypothetical protein DAPPUDRAFT_115770 [Daphnia pulex]|eukprot:EFX67080.1 hypothetical protein DAPPUDRAFT_115770 [Daphnia pulex]
MPFDEVEQLVGLEKVLMGEKHSRICMEDFYRQIDASTVENLKRRRSKKRNFPNDSPRLSDWRQESIVLVSTDILLNSDFVPVSLGLYCRNKKFEESSIVELKDFIQKARSQGGSWFRTINKISHSEAMNNHLAALEEDPDCRAESVVFTSTIKLLASVLSSDFKAFQFQ